MGEIISSVPSGGDLHRRIDRIERLLENIGTELRNMARMEERLSQADAQHHESFALVRSELQEALRRIREMEIQLANSSIVTRWGERVFWAIIAMVLVLMGHHVMNPAASTDAAKQQVERAQSGK